MALRSRQIIAPNKQYQVIPKENMNKKLVKPVELVLKDCRSLVRQRQLMPDSIYKTLLEQMEEDLENRISIMREKSKNNYNQFLVLKNKRKEGFVTKNQAIFFHKYFYEEQLNLNGMKINMNFSKYEKIKKLLDDKTEMIQRMHFINNLMKKYQDYLNNSLKDVTKDLVYQTKMAIIYKKKSKKLESQMYKLEKKKKNKKSNISVSGFFSKIKKDKKKS